MKARAYALRGDSAACLQHVELADRAHADARGDPVEGWVSTIATPAHLHAGTGHALATLARRTGSETPRPDALRRLGRAVDELDPVGMARATALCLAQLTAMHLEAGDLDDGVAYGKRLLDVARGVRSCRLSEHLAVVRRAAGAHAHEVMVEELVAGLDARAANPPSPRP